MSKPMKKMLLIVGLVFLLIFGVYGVKKILFFWFMSHYSPPAITVSANPAVSKTWRSYLESIGTLTAVNGVEISPEIAGMIKEIRFTSGQSVKQNDILVLLDTNIEQAVLKDHMAQLKLAEINYQRDMTLQKKNAVPLAIVDATYAKLQQAIGSVEQTQAIIKEKTIVAPFDGKIGISQVNIGQYLAPGTPIVTLQSLDPLLVRFNLPEQFVNEVYLNQPADISVNLSGEKIIHGTITAINSKVDETTRNILIEATIPNKEMQLLPGMYAGIKIWLKEQKNVVTLPQTSISYSLHGDSVFIIKTEGKGKNKEDKPLLKAYRQYVKVGERRGSEIAILEGVVAGDQIVTSGQLKLQNGTPVVINNSVELD